MSTPDRPAHDPYGPRDVLGDVVPAAAPGRSRARTGLLAAAVVGVLGVAGAGAVAAFALSGGGTQPEDVLPANAILFAKLDLDPAAGQKLNVYRLSQRFPEAARELEGEQTLRDDLLRQLFEGQDIDYDRQVAPWLGDRVGIAAVPSGGEEPDVVAALAYTDRGEAERALGELGNGTAFAFAFVDDYVLVGDDQAVVDEAAGTEEHLADDARFTEAVDSLDGDHIALAWGDVGRFWDAVPQELRAAQGAELDPTGQVVLGLRAESDAVEVLGRTIGLRTGAEGQDVLSSGRGSGLAGDLPAEAVAALSVTGLGESVTAGYEALSDALEALVPDLEAQAAEFGIELPRDLATVLGRETAVAAWGDQQAPEVLVRTRSDDPQDALDVLRRAFTASGAEDAGFPFDDYAEAREDGLAVGTPAALAAGSDLGDLEAFRRAVPDADAAGLVLWVSVQDALALAQVEPSEDTAPFEAVGLTASGSADAELRLRVVFD